MAITIEEKREKRRQYYIDNKERENSRNKRYYLRNKDKLALKAKARNSEIRERRNRYYKDNKKAFSNSRYLSKYKITLEDFELLSKTQLDSCKICGTHKNNLKRGLFVDHCHITGKIRGLLCHYCNSGLGLFKDSECLLEKTINYLKSSKNDS